jgi:cell wall assembly regulator SMI1
MKKRAVTIYDDSWESISQQHTEYDVDILANIIAPAELNRILNLERNFGLNYPDLRIKYNLIEMDSQGAFQFSEPNAKLIYDSDLAN